VVATLLVNEWAKSLYATLVLLSAIFSNRFEAPLKLTIASYRLHQHPCFLNPFGSSQII
jgi:hypothetical protein